MYVYDSPSLDKISLATLAIECSLASLDLVEIQRVKPAPHLYFIYEYSFTQNWQTLQNFYLDVSFSLKLTTLRSESVV